MVELPKFSTHLPSGYEFHHIGYATYSLEKERALFNFLGYKQEGEIFTDAVQGIKGCFLVGAGPRIELLENLPSATTLTPWLDAGTKMYHFAYLVANMQEALNWAKTQRSKIVTSPISAIAFNGRLISFVMFRNNLMLEFIEK